MGVLSQPVLRQIPTWWQPLIDILAENSKKFFTRRRAGNGIILALLESFSHSLRR